MPTDWQPLHTAPFGVEVLVYFAGSDYIGLAVRALGVWFGAGGRVEPTFWQPKPARPLDALRAACERRPPA